MSDIIKQTQLEQDEKTRSAILINFKSGDDISIPLIQRKCLTGYNSAYRTYNMMISDGLISKPKNLSAMGKMK
jgi:hypothetical protein